MNKVLVCSIASRDGGVHSMQTFATEALERLGYDVTLAYYEPYSVSPDLSVPLFRIGQRAPSTKRSADVPGGRGIGIGAWLPELEFTHYLATRHWKALIDEHDAHVLVSGTALAGVAPIQCKKPLLAWIATDFVGDRRARAAAFPWYRRPIDWAVNSRVCRRLERRVLNRAHVLALSEHTRRELNNAARSQCVRAVLPMPVDTKNFVPVPDQVVPGRIGFVGRLDDPRKNISLLLNAFADARAKDDQITLELIGNDPSGAVQRTIGSSGLSEHVRAFGFLKKSALAQRLATWDAFVLPSHQEGLCIAALEAMSCGVPVISTNCGGPEEFIVSGTNGAFVDGNPVAMAAAICELVNNRDNRNALGNAARCTVTDRYSRARAEDVFAEAFMSIFGSFQKQECPA